MKKIFALQSSGKDQPRVIEAIKAEVRKYVKRERRKKVPEGVDFWDFDCKVGADKNEPAIKHVEEVIGAIDAVAAAGGPEVYVEIISKAGRRTKKPVAPVPGSEALNPEGGEIDGAADPATAVPAVPSE